MFFHGALSKIFLAVFCLECSCGVLARSFRGVLSWNSNFLRCFGTEFLTLFDFFHGSVSNTVPVHVLVEKKTSMDA